MLDLDSSAFKTVRGKLERFETRKERVVAGRGKVTQFNTYIWLEYSDDPFVFRDFERDAFEPYSYHLSDGSDVELALSNRTGLVKGIWVGGAVLMDTEIESRKEIFGNVLMLLLGFILLTVGVVIYVTRVRRIT